MHDSTPARGGRREGAGRKHADLEQAADYADYGKARALHEQFKAQRAELELRIRSNEYIPRAAVRQACATAMASMAQTLRSVPDNLERRLGVAPEVAEMVGREIDASLNTLADEFAMLSGAPA